MDAKRTLLTERAEISSSDRSVVGFAPNSQQEAARKEVIQRAASVM
jgi:hypothetical protein